MHIVYVSIESFSPRQNNNTTLIPYLRLDLETFEMEK